MDPQLFDRLTRAFSHAGNRRWLVRRLTSLPLTGLLAVAVEETAAIARGRKAHRHHAHAPASPPKAERRKEQRDETPAAKPVSPPASAAPVRNPEARRARSSAAISAVREPSLPTPVGNESVAADRWASDCALDGASAVLHRGLRRHYLSTCRHVLTAISPAELRRDLCRLLRRQW